jgi:hypothetical protein
MTISSTAVRARERADLKDAEPDQRAARAALDQDERGEQRDRDRREPERARRAPAEVFGLHDRVDEHDQAGRHGDRSRQIRAGLALHRARLGHVAQREHRGRDADRHVDEEDPLPAQQVGEDAAEQQAERAAARRDRAPHAERLGAVVALGKRGGDDRQRGGGDERAAEALQPAGDDEPGVGRREAVQQRGGREDPDAPQEQPAPAEQVAGAPAEQQEAAEHEACSC